jgi:hypothetical protein
MNKAIFRVFDKDITPNHPTLIRQYELEYEDDFHLMTLFKESRWTWDEFHVEVETDNMVMVSSCSYKEEFMDKWGCD